jgi:error-prone DNA polymerase
LRTDPDFEVPYEHPSLEPVLRDTLGAIVFQDQVLEVAMALAGFSPGEAEGLRRAMSRKRSEAAMQAYRERFIEGAIGRGVERRVAERVFEQIQGFSGFGFPKAHAAAFGLLAYQSTWLRVNYGPEFLCALLNEQPMGFYPPDALVHDAQRRGLAVLPPHINRSGVECLVDENLAVRIGLGYVIGVREEEVRQLVEARREGGAYQDAGDLASRSGVGRDTLERLAWAGACDGLRDSALLTSANGSARRGSLWQLGVTASGHSVPGGVQLALPLEAPEPPGLPELTDWERLVADYGSFRISIAHHPMELLRDELSERVAASRDLNRIAHGSRVEVAGLVVARQRPATAKGVMFMLLEDEFGTINLIVAPPVYEQHRLVLRTEPFVLASGRLERREGTINLVVERIRALVRSDLPRATVKRIDPPVGRETGREEELAAAAGAGRSAAPAGDLRAVAPIPHSFGRRGR